MTDSTATHEFGDVPEGTRVSVDLPDVSDDAGPHPWLAFAGAWSEETADEVERFIEDTCEQIHPGDFRDCVFWETPGDASLDRGPGLRRMSS